MFSGLREHEMRSNPCIIGAKILFDLNIIILNPDRGFMHMKKVLFVASEAVPFIKTGGLADVVGSLPKEFDKEK